MFSNISHNDKKNIELRVNKIISKIYTDTQRFLDRYEKRSLNKEAKEYIYKFVLLTLKEELGDRNYNVLANYLNKKGIELFVESKYFYNTFEQRGENYLTIQFIDSRYWKLEKEFPSDDGYGDDVPEEILQERFKKMQYAYSKKNWTIDLESILTKFITKLYQDGQFELNSFLKDNSSEGRIIT